MERLNLTTAPSSSIRLSGISKAFEGARALDDVCAEIRIGTIHALVGENGAGKSTLGKIIAGVIGPDTGTIEFDTTPVQFASPRDAIAHGVTMVAQELALVPTRSVLENVYLRAEDHFGPFVRTRKLRDRFQQLSMKTGIFIDPSSIVGELSVADQQKVEVLRALARNASVIVMDEPTARLATDEALGLRSIIKRLREAGTTVIYVSHFLEEVLDLADDITVLRDGKVVSSGSASGETTGSLVELMIGRTVDTAFPEKSFPQEFDGPRLEVRELSGSGFADVSLDVRRGEIVALAGLVGSGRSEVLRAIYGADATTGGTVMIDGKKYERRSPQKSIALGTVMLPESRKTQGLFLNFSIKDNVSISALDRFSNWSFVRPRVESTSVSGFLDDVRVKMHDMSQPVGGLSGGNQQKALFAKALITEPRLLLVDEPTRGVDVGAKRQIYDLLTRLAQDGLSILMVSSEMEEVIGLAHRVVVMRQGHVVGTLAHDGVTERQVADLAFGKPSADTEL